MLPTKYGPAPELVITVDGVALDVLLAEQLGIEDLRGLVPALSSLEDAGELSVALERFRSEGTERTNAPVLVCPDDLDFSCSVVIAEIERSEGWVTWNRLGLDASPPAERRVGDKVDWFAGIGPWRFPRGEYESCFNAFAALRR